MCSLDSRVHHKIEFLKCFPAGYMIPGLRIQIIYLKLEYE